MATPEVEIDTISEEIREKYSNCRPYPIPSPPRSVDQQVRSKKISDMIIVLKVPNAGYLPEIDALLSALISASYTNNNIEGDPSRHPGTTKQHPHLNPLHRPSTTGSMALVQFR